jgi:tetratricopeptide (TPR) repeat protein
VALHAVAPARRLPRLGEAAAIVALAGIVFAVGWSAQTELAGTSPTGHLEAGARTAGGAELSTELTQLVEAAQARPDDIIGWKVLAGALVRELQKSERPPSRIVFESMEALSNVLRLDPKDPDALIAFADLSFNQQVFDKAIGLYERYIAVVPDDLGARSRYASSLAFLQKYPEAIKELQGVLAKDPDNFHASAYLAITYAQMGRSAEALTSGERALTLAPSDAARARFADFLKTVKEAPPANGNAAPAGGAEPEIVKALRQNQVAGPKFVRFEERGSEIHLYLNEFPMSQMPPFAKEKFFAGLRAAKGSFRTVVFFEASNGRELERIDFTK